MTNKSSSYWKFEWIQTRLWFLVLKMAADRRIFHCMETMMSQILNHKRNVQHFLNKWRIFFSCRAENQICAKKNLRDGNQNFDLGQHQYKIHNLIDSFSIDDSISHKWMKKNDSKWISLMHLINKISILPSYGCIQIHPH